MDKKTLLIFSLENRRTEAVKVQKILTDFGCIIKTRLGIHDGVLDKCSNTGLIILELVGVKAEVRDLERRLKAVKSVRVKLVVL
jgi:alcohol dehydrogenase YqhD (iron-dependent ADH family)